jgi:hypothetical protein
VNARRFDGKGGGAVQAPTSIKFPPDCWRFVQDMRTSSTPTPLPADVDAILSSRPGIEILASIAEPRFVVDMTRPQAEALQRWLHGLLAALSVNDPRRLTCLHCIGRVAVAIRIAEH